MGCPETEVNRASHEARHQVKVSDFYMSRYEVTVAEFTHFIAESGYRTDAEQQSDAKNWRCGVAGSVRPLSEENHPVLNVSWNDAVAYCKWMSDKTGKRYRLPTEAEWEYACRAGSRTPFNTGKNLTTAQANYNGNDPCKNKPKGVFRQNTVAVNSFSPNAWGLYNMHGNVWELCSDVDSDTYYDECKAKGVVENPAGPVPEPGSYRVLRGGSWRYGAEYCQSANSLSYPPDFRGYSIGFRPVIVP